MAILLPALILASALTAVYWPIVTYPFIQDDWGQLSALVSFGPLKYVLDGLSIKDKLFYRPLSQSYFALYYRFFGWDPLPFHVIGLLIHFLNSLLVVFISWRLIRKLSLAWVAGIIYAVAVTVHLDPLLWLVGFYDLAASFFYLSSISLLLAKRGWLSAMAFGLGILAKESTVVLGLAFPLIIFYTDQSSRRSSSALLRKLWPWAAIAATYCLVRMSGAISPFSLPSTEPYSMQLMGDHIFKNLFRYVWWSLEAVTPFRALASGTVRWVLWGASALAVLLYFYCRRSPALRTFPLSWIGFLTAWAAVGIVPALLLPNHFYKYYLTESLPPLVLLTLTALYWVYSLFTQSRIRDVPDSPAPNLSQSPLWPVSEMHSSHRYPTTQILLAGLFVVLPLADVVSAAQYFRTRDLAGISDQYTIGTNHLIHRGHAASLILDYLRDHHKSVPTGCIFLIDGCDLESLGNEVGLQTYYGDSSIRVLRLSDVVRDCRSEQTQQAPDGSSERPHYGNSGLESQKLFCLRIVDGKVLEEDAVRAIGRK